MARPDAPFRFRDPEGTEICRKIIQNYLPFAPHDYQLEGVTRALDGEHVLAITATGSGKSGFIYMLMIVLQEIARNDALRTKTGRAAAFPKDPIIIVISPTTALEEDQEKKMSQIGLTAKAVNSVTKQEAAKTGRNIWELVSEGVAIILLSPEMLATPGFASLLEREKFKRRIYAFVTDEIHLLVSWGGSFRPQFEQLGFIRARLLEKAVFIGLTATLRPGKKTKAVCSLLGLADGESHLIRRSNARPDVQILVRTLRANQASERFPQLDWVLRENRKVLFFCSSIRFGFNLAVYLWHLDPKSAIDQRTIRLFNSLNSAHYNSQTLELLEGSHRSKITIATDKLSVGVDVSDFETVIVIDPKDLDDFWQKGGRVGRDRTKVTNPRVILYLSQAVMKQAREALEAEQITPSQSSHKRKTQNSDPTLRAEEGFDLGLARVVTAACIPSAIDNEYDNPAFDPPCSPACTTCSSRPPPLRREPCDCSGCAPEQVDERPAPITRAKPLPLQIRVTKAMREVAFKRLRQFRLDLWEQADEATTGMFPVEAFLPDDVIDMLLDAFPSLLSKQALSPLAHDPNHLHKAATALLQPFTDQSHLLHGSAVALFEVLWDLHRIFDDMRLESRQLAQAKRAAKCNDIQNLELSPAPPTSAST